MAPNILRIGCLRMTRPSSTAEIFLVYLKLGCTAFGGPIAHLAYFERSFVQQRKWLTAQQYAGLLTLCQFLPGPASSQMGYAIGLTRGGIRGGLAAFVGLTTPSVILMIATASLTQTLDGPIAAAVVHGLKLVAVSVVAAGVFGLASKLAPDAPRALLAAVGAAAVLLAPSAWFQLAVIALGGVIGATAFKQVRATEGMALPQATSHRTAIVCLVLFATLLVSLPIIAGLANTQTAEFGEAFYRAGALVFGGGHVVLPLLEQSVVEPGWMSQDAFLAGYGAAQAVPGPMFTLSAYLGTVLGGWPVALLAVAAIFLPGMLLVTGALPFWAALSANRGMARALAGINAAVLGLLIAALYDPVWTSAVHNAADFSIALIGFVLLVAARWSALWVVTWCVLASVGAYAWGLT